MKHNTGALEPGVLPTFRLFIGVQLLIAVLGVLVNLLLSFELSPEVIEHFPAVAAPTGAVNPLTLIAAESLLLFLFLSVPSLRRVLKTYYLPVGVIWAAAWPILISCIEFYTAGENAPQVLQSTFWQQIILLFIPLIVVSWQYSIRQVIVLCLITTGLNHALLFSRFTAIENPVFRSLLGIVLVQAVVFFLVGHMIVSLVRVQREQRQSLTEANQRLAQHASTLEQLTISRERNRLARELHDVLAHTLSGVAVELEGLRAVSGRDPQQAGALLDHALQAVRDGLTDTRRALRELRAKPLEDLGLALAVKTLAESMADRLGFEIEVTVADNLDGLSGELEQCIYRIAQEALTNIADHAQAKRAQLILEQEDAQTTLTITDDGQGFDSDALADKNRYGLRGMRERAEMAGGNLLIESQPGRGTRIVFLHGVAE